MRLRLPLAALLLLAGSILVLATRSSSAATPPAGTAVLANEVVDWCAAAGAVCPLAPSAIIETSQGFTRFILNAQAAAGAPALVGQSACFPMKLPADVQGVVYAVRYQDQKVAERGRLTTDQYRAETAVWTVCELVVQHT